MRRFFVVLLVSFLIGSFSAMAADLTGSVEMHSRLISTFSGNEYSENPTMTAELTLTKGLSFTGFYSADIKDSQTMANFQEFIISGSKTFGKTTIGGMFETVKFNPVDGVDLYPSVSVTQSLGGGVDIDFLYCYNIESIHEDDEAYNSSSSHIGITKKFDDWSIVARGHRSGSSTNFSSAVTKEIHKNFSVTAFYHVTDLIGSPNHFGGVSVGYSF